MKNIAKSLLMKLSPYYRMMQNFSNAQNKLEQSIRQDLNRIESTINRLEKSMNNMFWLLQPNSCTIFESQKNFWSQYPDSQGDLKIVQQGNLIILSEMKKICELHNISFWLHGGTLIGAERHQGPIPWDDDIDVGMMREDLDRLIKITESDNKYKVYQYFHDDHNFSKGYQFKCCDKRMPCYIDIFVFDRCNTLDINDRNVFLHEFRENRRRMVNEFLSLPRPLVVEDIGYFRFGPFSHEDKALAEKILNRYANLMGNLYVGNSIYYAMENYPFPYPVMDENEVFPMREVKFGKKTYLAPKNSNLYLTGYGNIWNVPADIGISAHLYWYLPHIDHMKEYIKNEFGEII